jgi:hypothetical protein
MRLVDEEGFDEVGLTNRVDDNELRRPTDAGYIKNDSKDQTHVSEEFSVVAYFCRRVANSKGVGSQIRILCQVSHQRTDFNSIRLGNKQLLSGLPCKRSNTIIMTVGTIANYASL